jgi:hypothetical protein
MLRAARMLVLSVCLVACVREDVPDEARVNGPRILAVLAEPPEAAPGEPVHLRALFVDGTGPRTAASVRWALCQTPRSLRENTSVSAACAERDERPLSAHELELDALIPRDACARFGSETALGERPLDPDHSGGYYQPLRLSVDDLPTAIVRQRIVCPLANAPIDVTQRFNQRYTPNRAPAIAALRAVHGAEELSFEALPAHSALELQLTFAEDARETYPLYDALHGQLDSARERLEVRWYVTRGALAHASDAPSGETAENVLSTQATGSKSWLWLIVRDDRGGVSALEQPLRIVDD